MNPYNPCVTKKMINREQMTIVWNNDDLKVSYKHPWETTKLAMRLLMMYGHMEVKSQKNVISWNQS